MAHLLSCGCEGEVGILVENYGGYNLGFIPYVLPQLVLINVNCLQAIKDCFQEEPLVAQPRKLGFNTVGACSHKGLLHMLFLH